MFLHQKLNYDYKHIDTSDLNEALRELGNFLEKAIEEKADYICYDTETDGLNIITSKPFLVAIGFNKTVRTFNYNDKLMSAFWSMYNLNSKKLKVKLSDNPNFIGLAAHNAKFDYHMMTNGGSPIPEDIALLDSITIARLTEYADERESMSLESLGVKYVDDNAKFAGKVIKDIIKKINHERRTKVRELLIEYFPEDDFGTLTKSGKYRGTKKLTDLLDAYDKRVNYIDDDNMWFNFISENYEQANYEDVYKLEPDLMRNYAADDVVIELEYMKKAVPTLINIDKDLRVTKREGQLIRAVANMERTGLKVDVNYVLESRRRLCQYRDLLYMELLMYTGVEFSVGQHEFIKKLLLNKYNIKTDKADEKALKYIINNSNDEEVKDVCKNILELRTLDKWISTYVDGKLNSLVNGRIYTDINNNGAVSGRVSCDMQQQPKEGLSDRDGNELFHPRRMFICDEDYCLAFCDR